jgi:hypothetical protein
MELVSKISKDVAIDISAMIDEYGTVDAEITFNKYFTVEEVPTIYRFFPMFNGTETKIHYTGPINPIVPASLLINAVENQTDN